MARLAFKPDASFFRKIATGAVGTRAIHADLSRYGHQVVELERGAMDTKLWKEVKRKRVRIPDLVCTRCGIRIESRAKTRAELSMSHSPTDASRAWDFGMVDDDWIAFPVCEVADEKYWSTGKLGATTSYWHERNWVRWHVQGWINYFPVQTFRVVPSATTTTKGVTEGSETSIAWNATFATNSGSVEVVQGPTSSPGSTELAVAAKRRITIRRNHDGHRQTRSIPANQTILVDPGDEVRVNQVIAATVEPLQARAMGCRGALPAGHIMRLLRSRERTLRFTGVKLARLRREQDIRDTIQELTADPEEDVYIRLEGVAYLASVGGESAQALFQPYLGSTDQQTQLEAVIALGETATPEAVEVLGAILDGNDQPYFLRSAAAWCLGRFGDQSAAQHLVRAFSDIDRDLRDEALEGIISVGGTAVPVLLLGLHDADADVAAGCAEALRQ